MTLLMIIGTMAIVGVLTMNGSRSRQRTGGSAMDHQLQRR
jgi:hypothetical protein